MLRALDSRWVSRAGNLSFIIGVGLFVRRYVSHQDPLFLVGVVALLIGVFLMAAPRLSKWLEAKQSRAAVAAEPNASVPGMFAIETSGSFGMTRIYSGVAGPDDQMLVRVPQIRITNQQTLAWLSLHFQLALPEEVVGFSQLLEAAKNAEGIPAHFHLHEPLFVPLSVGPGKTVFGDVLFILPRTENLDGWLEEDRRRGLGDLKPELKVIDYVSDRFVTLGLRARVPSEGPLPLESA